jgi:hypothetical protein
MPPPEEEEEDSATKIIPPQDDDDDDESKKKEARRLFINNSLCFVDSNWPGQVTVEPKAEDVTEPAAKRMKIEKTDETAEPATI